MKNSYIYLLFVLFVVVSPSADAQTLRGGIEVSDIRLTTTDAEVALDMTLKIAGNAAAKCQSVAIIPSLVNGTQTVNLPYVLVNGRKAKNIYERHNKFGYTELRDNPPYKVVDMGKKPVGETTVSYSTKIPAEKWTVGATLQLGIVVASCGGERMYYTAATTATVVSSPEVDLVEMAKYTPPAKPSVVETPAEPADKPIGSVETPVEEPFVPTYVESPVAVKTIEHTATGSAYLDFEFQSSYIDPTYGNNSAELTAINRVMDRIKANPKAHITSLSIEGYASPEERYAGNEELAYERAMSLARYLQSRYGISTRNTKVGSAGEDWVKLRELVAASNIAYRSEILQIIDSYDHPDAKESRLRRLAGGRPWNTMFDTMFPELRRAEYRVTYTVPE
jgi:outer membrane protein OmpA-like peptidoglycan-associated protein